MGKTGHLRFTIYDLRFGNLARRRRGDAERMRSGIFKTMRGRGYKAAGAAGHLRFTTEADGGCLCTRYDVRCTIAIIARFARDGGG